MENATKALLIAGGILLAILVLSVGVMLYKNLKEDTSSYTQQMDTARIQQINAKFENFLGRKNIRIHEIVSLYNFIKENKAELPSDIGLLINDTDIMPEKLDKEGQLELIKDNSNKNYKLNDNEGLLYNDRGQVNFIQFENIVN